MSNQTTSIPVRRMLIKDPNQMPKDYSTTPGGTLFGTTPGGSRIIYEKAFLLRLSESPRALRPPANLPYIPGVTQNSPPLGPAEAMVGVDDHSRSNDSVEAVLPRGLSGKRVDESQFEMDL